MKKLVLLLLLSISFWSNCFTAQKIPQEVSGFLNIRAKDITTAQDLETIKLQFKTLAFKYHPDKNPTGEEFFKRILSHWQNLKTIVTAVNKSPQSDNFSASSQGRTPTTSNSPNSTTSDRSSNESPYSRTPTPPQEPSKEDQNKYYLNYLKERTDALIQGKTSFMTFNEYIERIKQQEIHSQQTAARRYQEETKRQEMLHKEQERAIREEEYAKWEKKYTQQYFQPAPPIELPVVSQKRSSLPESSLGGYLQSTRSSLPSTRSNSPTVTKRVEPISRPVITSPTELLHARNKDKKLDDFLNFPIERITASFELDKSITPKNKELVVLALITGNDLKKVYKNTGIYNAIEIKLTKIDLLNQKIRDWERTPLVKNQFTRRKY